MCPSVCVGVGGVCLCGVEGLWVGWWSGVVSGMKRGRR